MSEREKIAPLWKFVSGIADTDAEMVTLHPKALATLRRALARDADERKQIVEVLKACEFVEESDSPHTRYCPLCDSIGDTHAPDCRLSALLTRLKEGL